MMEKESGPSVDQAANHQSFQQVMAGGELQRRAASGSFWTATHTVIAAPLAFVVNAIVARILGPVEYGGLALLTMAMVLVSQVTNMGVSQATVQWGASFSVQGSRDTVGALLSKSLGYHVLIQLPLLIISVLVIARNEGIVAAVLVMGVALPAALGSASLLVAIENRTAAGAKIAMLSNLLVQASVLAAAVITDSPTWVWAARIAAAALLVPLNFLVLDSWGRRAALRMAWPRRLPGGFWRFASTSMVAGLASILVFSRSEVLILTWLEAAATVGIFALAYGVAAQITAPVDAIIGPLTPAAAGLVAAHPERVRAGRDRAVRAAAFLAGGILASVVPFLVNGFTLLYGKEYEAAQFALLALAATSCLRSACNPLTAFVNARRMAGALLRMTTIALVVDICVAVALIPLWGLWGGIVANAAAQCSFLAQLAFVEARQEGDRVRSVIGSLRAWFVALGAALVAVLLGSWSSDAAWLAATTSAIAGTALFVMGIRATRSSLTDSDWHVLREAVPKPARPVVQAAAKLFGRH